MGNAQKKSSGTSSGVFSPVHSRARDGGNPGNAEGKKAAHVNGAYTAEETGNTGTHGVNLDAPAGDLPPPLARLKNEGNMLFKTGQFGLALQKYTQAIEGYTQAKEKYTLSTEGHTLSAEGHTLSTEGHTLSAERDKLSGIDSPEDLCILYSNRAACFLKDGNCTDCIQDCTSALELRPFSLKPLLRRAMAYESLERYRNAYVDYKTVLQIDSSVQAAHDSVHRITKQLMEQDGPDWREKLPEIPNVPISAQQHRREEPSADVLHARAVRAEEEKVRKAEARFTLLKEEGNDLVKRGEFQKAMQKYSECIALRPTECSVYTNRALCLLKLDRFAEARQDCDSALQIESDNKKAFYRRALAHKGLKDFLSSSSDLQEVLRLDPNVREAEQELQEVTVLLRESLLESNTQD